MTEFAKLVEHMNMMTQKEIEAEFDMTFAFTGFEGVRFHVAKWLVEDILIDGIEFMSQEFFEEVFAMYDNVVQDPEYFGGEFPFIETGEVI